MNARDNIKPKSIRLAILIALADGQITTIDDLLMKVEETRKKVIENAGAAANDGLLKRMRDDVTGLAAYQITAAGMKYVAKFGDGKKVEPVSEPVVKESLTTAHETKKAELSWEKSMMETVGEDGVCDVVKAIESIKAARDNAFAELRSIRTAIGADREESTLDEVQRVVSQLKSAKASLELSQMARAVVHVGYVIQRPVKPLVRCTKLDRAKDRAMSFARSGKKAQVFALVPVGIAVPGTEWVAA